jgi:hypothetical protein
MAEAYIMISTNSITVTSQDNCMLPFLFQFLPACYLMSLSINLSNMLYNE